MYKSVKLLRLIKLTYDSLRRRRDAADRPAAVFAPFRAEMLPRLQTLLQILDEKLW